MSPETYLHSDIQDIMVTKPSFVLKWGSLLIAVLLLVLLAFTAWFQYPEFITTEVSLAAQPLGLVAPNARSAPGWSSAPYLALGTISAEEYAVVRPGQPVLLRIRELGAAQLNGRVLAVAPLAQQQQHRVVIEVNSAAGRRLQPSFSGIARIKLRQRSLLTKFLASSK
jgi:hypothetical protein